MGGKNRVGGRCANGAQKQKYSRKRRCRAVLLAALGAVVAAPVAVHAITYSWNINASGLFETAANWSPAGPPVTNLDIANFDQTGTYTVTFQTSKTNNAFTVGNGNVTFALSGQTYTLTATSIIGDTDGQTGRLTLSNGTVNSSVGYIGLNPADTGFLTVTTNTVLNSSSSLFVGYFGTGTLTVQNGGDITTTGSSIIGSDSTALGTATVSGSGSTWTSNGQFAIGNLGPAAAWSLRPPQCSRSSAVAPAPKDHSASAALARDFPPPRRM